ncbi:MAG: glycosyltransferase, partial [Chloroflexota bacterium]
LSGMTHAVRPLKVLEYLAMGKPVVAAPLQEIQAWPGVLTANDPEAFAQKLDLALSKASSWAQGQEIRDFVAASSWQQVVVPLLERLL